MRRAVVKPLLVSLMHSERLVEAGMEKGAKSRSAPQSTPYWWCPSWWRKEKRKKSQISARSAVRVLLTLSFLPKTVIVPVFETENSYP